MQTLHTSSCRGELCSGGLLKRSRHYSLTPRTISLSLWIMMGVCALDAIDFDFRWTFVLVDTNFAITADMYKEMIHTRRALARNKRWGTTSSSYWLILVDLADDYQEQREKGKGKAGKGLNDYAYSQVTQRTQLLSSRPLTHYLCYGLNMWADNKAKL